MVWDVSERSSAAVDETTDFSWPSFLNPWKYTRINLTSLPYRAVTLCYKLKRPSKFFADSTTNVLGDRANRAEKKPRKGLLVSVTCPTGQQKRRFCVSTWYNTCGNTCNCSGRRENHLHSKIRRHCVRAKKYHNRLKCLKHKVTFDENASESEQGKN